MGAALSRFLSEGETEKLKLRWGSQTLHGAEADARELFTRLDKGSDGMLGKEEFATALGILGCSTSLLANFIYDAIDVDQDGHINFYEFLEFMLVTTRGSVLDKLAFGFRLIDLDRNNLISKPEIVHLIQSMYQSLTNLKLNTSMYSQFIEELCEVWEFDENGFCDYEKYKEGCLKNSSKLRKYGCHMLLSPQPAYQVNVKIGRSVFFGDRMWNFMLGVMLAIELMIERLNQRRKNATLSMVVDRYKDDYATDTFELPTMQSGQRMVVSNYAPEIFRDIREHFGIDDEQYALSLGLRQVFNSLIVGDLTSMSGMVSEGKSMSFFYYSHNSQFMVKTISEAERDTFLRILQSYYVYMLKHRDTFLSRIFGLHTLTYEGKDHHFIVMGNVFDTTKPIDLRFDLKGSTVGRQACPPGTQPYNPKVVYKDLDFLASGRRLFLAPEHGAKLLAQLTMDANFLRNHQIIDYSLLVGIHMTDKARTGDITTDENTESAGYFSQHGFPSRRVDETTGEVVVGQEMFY
eukprot:Colp12_sorted_trinity150504_noHs@14561